VTQTLAAPTAAVAPIRPSSRQWALDALRLAAIAGVVAIHVLGLLVANDDWHGTRRWWAAVVVDAGSVWVVPVFVMISGALVLAPRAHAEGPYAFYRRRFARILPALLAWHLIYLVGVRIGLRGERPSPGAVLAMVVDTKLYTGLYFLWLIAGLYLLAPVFAAFLRDGGRRRALGTAAVTLAGTMLAYATCALAGRPISLTAWTQWIPYAGYFVAGWALHRVYLGGRALVAVSLVAVLTLTGLIWQYGHRDAFPLLRTLVPNAYVSTGTAVVAGCLFLTAVAIGTRRTPSPRTAALLRRLSDASFGVFLVHLLLLELVRRAVPEVAAASSFGWLAAAYAVILASSFLVSLVLAKVPYLRALV
jgi:surface polysaccharide O-acyltransferase-like enzyme